MPQTSFTLETGKIGELATSEYGKIGSKLNPLVAEVWTATVGGTATDGVYSFRVKQTSEDTGTLVSVTRTGGSPASNNDLAAALQAAGEAIASLRNVANFTVAAAVVTVTAIQYGVRFDLTDATAPAPGTLTVAQTVSSTGTTLEVGRCVVRGSAANEIALPGASSTIKNVVGFIIRGADMLDNTGDPWDVDGYAPGAQVPVNNEIPMFVESETSASEGDDVYVRRIASATQKLGVIRNSGAGTARVETATPTPANSTLFAMSIEVDRDGNGEWESYQISTISDASATATEICDGLRTHLATIDALLGVVTGSGTTTLVLTGAAGVKFESHNLGTGVIAVAETTAGTFETFKARNVQYDRALAASGRARIRLNLPRV